MLGVGPRTAEPVVELATFSIQTGGAVGTTLATVAAFGGRARYFGRLSDDEVGSIILRGLKEFGVDVSQVLIEPGKVSPGSFILVDERTGRRLTRFTRGSTTPLEPGELPRDLFDDTKILLVDGRTPAAHIAAAERAKGLGVTVLLDLSDIVIGNERFAAEFSHSSDMKRSLVELTQMGPKIAVLTLGEEGAIALENETLVRQPALPIEVYDTTGASEVFRGAFIYGTLQGWPLDRCLPFANAAAALNCRHLGGTGGIPALSEVIRAAGLSA